jgi:hypothetical protein
MARTTRGERCAAERDAGEEIAASESKCGSVREWQCWRETDLDWHEKGARKEIPPSSPALTWQGFLGTQSRD